VDQMQEQELHSAVERYSRRVTNFVDRHSLAFILILTLVYFTGTVLRARGKPFWYDELLTVLAATQPTFAATIQAARDLDLTPPLTDLVGHVVNRVAGSGEVVFRLPAMVGFWIFCLCLFRFAARRVNTVFALVAMLLPFLTYGESYAFEARSYGMMLGFCGVALWSWQSLTMGIHRGWSFLGLAIGLAGALACHYYAVLIYLPLAGAEAFRTLRLRMLDKSVWAAFALGMAPLILSLLHVRQVANLNQHVVLHATRRDYLAFYSSAFANSLWFVVPALILCAAWLILRRRESHAESGDPDQVQVPAWELLAAALFLVIPVAAITISLVVPPHMFADRYALPSIGGFALAIALVSAILAGNRCAPGIILALPVLLLFGFTMTHGRPFENPFEKETMLKRALQRGPVVINDYVLYLQLWYYAPADVKQRILYLSDEDLSVKYSHIDDIMQPFQKYGVPVLSYRAFATPGTEFYLYFSKGLGWVPEKVLDDGGNIQVTDWSQGTSVLRIRLK